MLTILDILAKNYQKHANMSNILLVEKDMNLAEMYKFVFANFGFKVIHFLDYKELYKNLNGEGFTAIFSDDESTGETLDFISRVRKNSKSLIPIYVLLTKDTNPNSFLKYEKTTCLSKFPDSGLTIVEYMKSLSNRRQFKINLSNIYS